MIPRKERAQHAARLVGEGRPVGAELVAHHDAGHDSHAEGQREDLHPEQVEVPEDLLVGLQPQRLEHGEVTGKPYREAGKDDVERNRESELQSRQEHGIPIHDPGLAFRLKHDTKTFRR
jgi:hypothetical protein